MPSIRLEGQQFFSEIKQTLYKDERGRSGKTKRLNHKKRTKRITIKPPNSPWVRESIIPHDDCMELFGYSMTDIVRNNLDPNIKRDDNKAERIKRMPPKKNKLALPTVEDGTVDAYKLDTMLISKTGKGFAELLIETYVAALETGDTGLTLAWSNLMAKYMITPPTKTSNKLHAHAVVGQLPSYAFATVVEATELLAPTQEDNNNE